MKNSANNIKARSAVTPRHYGNVGGLLLTGRNCNGISPRNPRAYFRNCRCTFTFMEAQHTFKCGMWHNIIYDSCAKRIYLNQKRPLGRFYIAHIFLYWSGDTFSCCLNMRIKDDVSSYPAISAISDMGKSP